MLSINAAVTALLANISVDSDIIEPDPILKAEEAEEAAEIESPADMLEETSEPPSLSTDPSVKQATQPSAPPAAKRAMVSVTKSKRRGTKRMSIPAPKTIPCTFEGCDKMFNRHEHLVRHMRMHTGERPFSCSFPNCGRSFSRSDNLSAHYKSHTPKSQRFLSGFDDE
eukprot:jgi/Hompol1/2064/HPOL_005841-RA